MPVELPLLTSTPVEPSGNMGTGFGKVPFIPADEVLVVVIVVRDSVDRLVMEEREVGAGEAVVTLLTGSLVGGERVMLGLVTSGPRS